LELAASNKVQAEAEAEAEAAGGAVRRQFQGACKMGPWAMTFNTYLREIQIRFYYIFFVSFPITFLCSYRFSEQIFRLLAKPLEAASYPSGPASPWAPTPASPPSESPSYTPLPGRILDTAPSPPFHFIYTELTEGFFTYILISLYLTVYFLIFVTLYQVWLAIKPGFHLHETVFIKT
jgi:Sec-independent protein secretion pathway component TatC